MESLQILTLRAKVSSDSPESDDNVVIIDNDERVIRSLVDLFSRSSDGFSVLWTATSGASALRWCENPVNIPGLFLIDMHLEGLQGTDVCRRIRRANARTPILAMTCYSRKHYIRAAIEAGAQGLVDKSDDTAILHAMRLVRSGQILEGFDTPHLAYVRINRTAQRSDSLTDRELEIINLCAYEGMLNEEIAERLHISEATVRKHLQHIIEKLNVKNTRQAISLWLTNNDV